MLGINLHILVDPIPLKYNSIIFSSIYYKYTENKNKSKKLTPVLSDATTKTLIFLFFVIIFIFKTLF